MAHEAHFGSPKGFASCVVVFLSGLSFSLPVLKRLILRLSVETPSATPSAQRVVG